MKMYRKTKMEMLRADQGLTKAEVARRAKMQQNVIGWIESGRFKPYDSQLEKIADALGWEKDPRELLEKVE